MARRHHLGFLEGALREGMERKKVVRFTVLLPFSHEPEPPALAVGDAFPPAGAIIGRQGHGVAAGQGLGVEALVLKVHEQCAPRDHGKGAPAIFVDPGTHVKGSGD